MIERPSHIIDAHVHLDLKKYDTVETAATALIADVHTASVDRVLLFALEGASHLELESERVGELALRHPRIIPVASVNPLRPAATQRLTELLERFPFRALKLHPRFQGFTLDDPRVIDCIETAARLKLPVIIDSFPYFPGFYPNMYPEHFHTLALTVPDARIVLAHACGHRVLDALFLAKAHKNIYLDFSFTLLYFQGSSVPGDLVYAIKSLRGERVLYGSDYPDRGFAETLDASLAAFAGSGFSADTVDRIFYRNALDLFDV